MIHAAIVGCGAIHDYHANAIEKVDGAQVYAVCDIDATAAQKAAETYSCKAYTDYRDVLGDPEIHTVHICTPHYLHSEMAIAALRAGKDVLCEKPMCISVAEAEQLRLVCEETGRRFGVCFQNRYNITSRQAKELLDSGELGAVLGAKAICIWERNAAYYAQAEWRGCWATEGGGVLINQSIHTLDLVQWLLGDIESISGHTRTAKLYNEIEVEDTADAFIVFKSGAQCVFFSSNCHISTAPALIEVTTERGHLQILERELLWTPRDGRPESIARAEAATGPKAVYGIGHNALIHDFYEGLKTGASFPINAQEGAKSIRLIHALYRSSAMGRPTVM